MFNKYKEKVIEHQRMVFNKQLNLITRELGAKGFMVLHDPSGHDYNNDFVVVIKIKDFMATGDRERPYLSSEIERDTHNIPVNEELIGNIFLNGKVNEKNIHMDIFVTLFKGVLKYYTEIGEPISLQEILLKLKEILEKIT